MTEHQINNKPDIFSNFDAKIFKKKWKFGSGKRVKQSTVMVFIVAAAYSVEIPGFTALRV